MSTNQGIEKRVKVSEKKILNSVADVNQLVPFKYPWAWQAYLKSSENHWMPSETRLDDLKYQDLNPYQRGVLDSFLDQLVPRICNSGELFDHSANLLFMYRHNTAPECRQYLLRQGFEDAVAVHAYQWIVESINHPGHSPTFMVEPSYGIPDEGRFTTGAIGTMIYYIGFILENIVMLKGILPLDIYVEVLKIPHKGLQEIASKVIRDRMNHIQFGLNVINHIFDEHPELNRSSPEINVIFGNWEDAMRNGTDYQRAQLAYYRSMVQPLQRPYRHLPLESFNSGLEVPTIKQWLSEDHKPSEQPTTMSGLDWD
jgi:ribonucleoside-diphosphate reductase beta chain